MANPFETQIKARKWDESLYIAMQSDTFDIFAFESLSQADVRWAMWNFNERGMKDDSSHSESVDNGIQIRSLADLDEKEVEWLIPGYIPRGQVCILAGDGGVGKTALWCSLMASITTGTRSIFESDIPFDDKRKPEYCMFFSSEDSVDSVLRKRLRRSGADLSMIGYMDLRDPNFSLIKFDSIPLASIIKSKKPSLVVFDPLQSFLDGKLNMGARNAMRESLNPLVGLAESTGTTFLIVCHTNKRERAFGRNRVSDSSDIWDICRSAIIAGKTQDGRYYASHEKNNYGELRDSIIFSMKNGIATFEGMSSKHDREFMAEGETHARQAPAMEEAKEIICELLRDAPDMRMSIKDIDEAVIDQGVSSITLKRAKTELTKEGVVKRHSEGFGKDKIHFFEMIQ